jgi:hypothetical protein
MLGQGLLGKPIEFARLRIAFDCRIEPDGVDCKERNSDARAPARSVLAEPFNERSVHLLDRRRDDVVGRISIDHHIAAEMIALHYFFNGIVSPLANCRDLTQRRKSAIGRAKSAMDISSLMASQCRPVRHISTCSRWTGLARNNRGNHARGIPSVRPSVRSTHMCVRQSERWLPKRSCGDL